jgi:hypothetical protein
MPTKMYIMIFRMLMTQCRLLTMRSQNNRNVRLGLSAQRLRPKPFDMLVAKDFLGV